MTTYPLSTRFSYLSTSKRNREIQLLLRQSQEQIETYVTTGHQQHTAATALVAYAANGDDDALDALISLSVRYIEAKCQLWPAQEIEDVIQDVLVRIMRKFRNQDSPFVATTYPAYLSYLRLTIRSVLISRQPRHQGYLSLEALNECSGYEPSYSANDAALESRMLAESLLALLPCQREREAITRRYLFGESPTEIAAAMQERAMSISKKDVYRLVERGLRRLSKHPTVCRMQAEC